MDLRIKEILFPGKKSLEIVLIQKNFENRSFLVIFRSISVLLTGQVQSGRSQLLEMDADVSS